MFGNNAVGSSWANPQQNQQQQPAGGAFGQPSGFGTGAFGSGTFGQNPQQQPQANPMFGNLGTTPNTNTTGTAGFGAFNTSTPSTNTSNSLFGPKPASGFGAFGGGGAAPSTFGGGGFGQNANAAASTSTAGQGLFGNPTANTGGAFGSNASTGLFNNKPATTAFGAPQTNSQTGTYDGVSPVTTGSSNPPFSVFSEKDSTNGNVLLQYQAISCMPQYRGTSFEELRLQDYMQGRKTASTFGQPAGFGATTQPAAATTGIFGAPAAPQNPVQTSNSIFGGGNAAGTTNAFGAFGQPNQPAATAGTTTGTGLFGSFGQPPQQPAGFGAFGQTPQQPQQPQQPSGGLFGSGAFGANKPFSAFGNGGAFGGGTGTFGQPTQPQPGATGTGLFGQQQQPGASSGFGTTNAAKPSIFGPPTQPTQTNTGFGVFGSGQQPQNPVGQQPQPQQPGSLFGGSLFGGNQQPQPQQAQGLFGTTQPAPAGGLFGSTGGLFGNSTPQQPAQQPGGGFFKNPAPAAPAGSIFGNFGQPGANASNSTAPGQPGSLFGGTNQQPQGFGNNNLFGKPAAPTMGTSTSMGQSGGGSLFGSSFGTNALNASATAPGAQGSLTASISQPIGANLPIFSMLPPGPRAVSLDQQTKKKAGFFVDVPTRSPVPRLQLGYTPANTKLRGFGDSTSSSSLGQGNGSALGFSGLSFSSGKPNALSLSRAVDNKTPVGPDAFLGRSSSPSLGSGSRQSVKKLILDKKVEPSDLFSKSGGSPNVLRGAGKVTFSPGLSVAVREKEAANAASSPPKQPSESPTPGARGQRAANRFTAHSTELVLDTQTQDKGASPVKGDGKLQEGEYWVRPELQTLIHAGHDELLAFKDLVVGRVGYGEIHFLEPVDLTGLPKLGALLGQVVRFENKECSVYPDSEEVDKPPAGTGLNVRARLILVKCWAHDKATREPVKDEKHPFAMKHLRRLKNMKDTHFESFELSEGKWTFTVDHF